MQKNETVVQRLCSFAQKRRIWDQKKADDIAKVFKGSSVKEFVEFVLTEELIERSHLLQILSDYYVVPAFDVIGYFFEHTLVHTFPKDILLRHEVIPLEVDETILFVVASDPSSTALVDSLRNYVSYDIHCLVGIGRDIADAVKEFYDESLATVNPDSGLPDEHRERNELQDHIDSDDVDLDAI